VSYLAFTPIHHTALRYFYLGVFSHLSGSHEAVIYTFIAQPMGLKNLIKYCTKIHSFQQRFSFYENKVLQLMSAGANLERFGEKTLFS
jgi:hypothetical protein